MPNKPLRVRLVGGRLVHAATEGYGHPSTLCGRPIDVTDPHEWPDDAEVTCRKCQRAA